MKKTTTKTRNGKQKRSKPCLTPTCDPFDGNDDIPKGTVLRDGFRHPTLFKRACRLLREGKTEEQVFRALARINKSACSPTLSPCMIEKICQSAYNREEWRLPLATRRRQLTPHEREPTGTARTEPARTANVAVLPYEFSHGKTATSYQNLGKLLEAVASGQLEVTDELTDSLWELHHEFLKERVETWEARFRKALGCELLRRHG